METKIIVPRDKSYPTLYIEGGWGHEEITFPKPWLTAEELAAATKKFPVVCTDVVLIDQKGRFVLAKRKHACAKGWWWKGGGLNANSTPGQNIARLMEREIGRVPESVTFVDSFFHVWKDTRERPGEVRTDLIYLHSLQVDENDIAQIQLDSEEYNVGAGLMRFDGTQKGLRPVLYAIHSLIQTRLQTEADKQ